MLTYLRTDVDIIVNLIHVELMLWSNVTAQLYPKETLFWLEMWFKV